MIKRAGAVLVAFLVLVGCGVAAAAQDTAAFELVGLGVLEADKTGDEALSEPMTRAEFAQVAARLISGTDSIEGLESGFVDVERSAPYYDSIAMLESMGVFQGDGNGLFRPENTVTGIEVVKTLIYCIGYDAVAESRGGYPDGYQALAAHLGLYKNVMESVEMTRRSVARMIYNALDIEPGGDAGNNVILPGETLRSVLMSRGRTEQIKGSGVIRATKEAYLDSAIPWIREDQVDIGGKLFEIGSTDADQYLGMEVDYRARYDTVDNTYRLTAARPTTRNEETVFLAADFQGAANGTVTYFQDDKTKSARYNNKTRLVRNNRAAEPYGDADIRADNGSFRMIDNDGDGTADVIFITEYQSGILDRVKGGILYLEKGSEVWNMRSVAIDDSDRDVVYKLRDTDGETLEAENLEPGWVVSVALSDDKSYYGITVSDLSVEGTVTGISDSDGIEINGEKWYKIEKGRDVDCSVGDEVVALLNFEEQVAGIKKASSSRRYGYIAGINKSGINTCEVKILNAGTLKAEERIDDSDPDNPVTTRILRAGNQSVSKIELASKILIDGKGVVSSERAADLLRLKPLVEYSLNTEGKIRRIHFPDKSGTGEERYYNSYEKTFGKLGDSVFATNESTRVICVPTNSVSNDRDLLAKIEMDTDDQKYMISGYEVDEQTGYADLVVLQASLSADAMGTINPKSKPALAEKVRVTLDENKEERLRIDLWSEGKQLSYYVAEFARDDAEMQKLRPGAVFYYALTNMDEIGTVEVLDCIDPAPAWYKTGNASSTMKLFGRVESVDYDRLSFAKNRFVHKMSVLTSLDGVDRVEVDINVRNTPDIYLYRLNKKLVGLLEPVDILASGKDRRVFAYVKNGEADVFVVVE